MDGYPRVLIADASLDRSARLTAMSRAMWPAAAVWTAQDLSGAQATAMTRVPEVVLVGIGTDSWGLALIRWLRHQSPDPGARVVAILEEGTEGLRFETYDAGADECLPEPFSGSDFRRLFLKIAAIP